jgi:hypothetical protein
MSTLTTAQNKRLHSLLTQCDLMEVKAELISSYTNGRTTHSSELLNLEYHHLVQYLTQHHNKSNTMRRKCIAMAYQMKWTLADGSCDYARLDDWCVKYGQFHQPLQKHSHTELTALVTQLQRVYKTFISDSRYK